MPFMTVVSPDLIQPNGSSPIHAAHVGGKLHAGAMMRFFTLTVSADDAVSAAATASYCSSSGRWL
eukprot:1872145-Rhodomonas_salina.1